MRLKLIACEIFLREMCFAVACSPSTVDVEFLPKGLHDLGSGPMRARLQEAIDACSGAPYDAILLGYGLCNNGVVGLHSANCPLIVPRAHDCITLFMGSKERYNQYFFANPGVYFLTSGWLERGELGGDMLEKSVQRRLGMDITYEQLVEKYGEEDAAFLFEELSKATKNYHQFTYIHMGIEPGDRFERQSRQRAAERKWKFEKMQGTMALIQRLVDGPPWHESEFLTVPPGHRIVASYDDAVVGARLIEPTPAPGPQGSVQPASAQTDAAKKLASQAD